MFPVIPDKTYFKIGEVAHLVDIKTSVLRFWEAEFTFLNPEKSSSGQRLYSKQDIETVLQIKQLLYHEKYTSEGVRKKLGSGKCSSLNKRPSIEQDEATPDVLLLLRQIRQELTAIRATL